MKKIVSSIFLVLAMLIMSTAVYAQQVSLSITPPIIEAVMKPGKSIMIAYTIKNSGDPTIINTRVVDFEPRNNFGDVRLKNELTGPVRFSLDNANLQLGQPFFLATGASQQLLLRIRLPENIPNGDHYYSFLAETNPPVTVEGVASSRAKATIATNILITVTDSGYIDIKPRITIFDTLSKLKLKLFGRSIAIFDSFDKVPVVLYMENKGMNKIVPAGKITMRGAFGQSAEYDIIPKNILANSQRLLEATPSATLSISQPKSLVLSGLFIGKYSLSADVDFGENSPTVFDSTVFYGFPFKILGGLAIVIAAAVFITKRFSKDED